MELRNFYYTEILLFSKNIYIIIRVEMRNF